MERTLEDEKESTVVTNDTADSLRDDLKEARQQVQTTVVEILSEEIRRVADQVREGTLEATDVFNTTVSQIHQLVEENLKISAQDQRQFLLWFGIGLAVIAVMVIVTLFGKIWVKSMSYCHSGMGRCHEGIDDARRQSKNKKRDAHLSSPLIKTVEEMEAMKTQLMIHEEARASHYQRQVLEMKELRRAVDRLHELKEKPQPRKGLTGGGAAKGGEDVIEVDSCGGKK